MQVDDVKFVPQIEWGKSKYFSDSALESVCKKFSEYKTEMQKKIVAETKGE